MSSASAASRGSRAVVTSASSCRRSGPGRHWPPASGSSATLGVGPLVKSTRPAIVGSRVRPRAAAIAGRSVGSAAVARAWAAIYERVGRAERLRPRPARGALEVTSEHRAPGAAAVPATAGR
ncbi:hypothetical protein [Streptomyces sp. NPDC046261]|uniref:hypothetical protein n=1 Tax=Streptomyces sp. NPDC046261 TaxID=3157200 RepID=UPI0033C9DEAF